MLPLVESLLISLKEPLNQKPSQLFVLPTAMKYSGPTLQFEMALVVDLKTRWLLTSNTKESKSTTFLSSWKYLEKDLLKQAPKEVPSQSSTQKTKLDWPPIRERKTRSLWEVESKMRQGVNFDQTFFLTISKIGLGLIETGFEGSSQNSFGMQSTLRLLMMSEMASIRFFISNLTTSSFLDARSHSSSSYWSNISSFTAANFSEVTSPSSQLAILVMIWLVSCLNLLNTTLSSTPNTFEFIFLSLSSFEISFSTAPQNSWTTLSELSLSFQADELIPSRTRGMVLVPFYLCILEHSARSQMVTGSLHSLLAHREMAGL